LNTAEDVEGRIADVNASGWSVTATLSVGRLVVPDGVEEGDDCGVVEGKELFELLGWEHEVVIGVCGAIDKAG
jgi:hypothetical protein